MSTLDLRKGCHQPFWKHYVAISWLQTQCHPISYQVPIHLVFQRVSSLHSSYLSLHQPRTILNPILGVILGKRDIFSQILFLLLDKCYRAATFTFASYPCLCSALPVLCLYKSDKFWILRPLLHYLCTYCNTHSSKQWMSFVLHCTALQESPLLLICL